MTKASGIVLFVISVILAAGFIAVRYFAFEIPYVPYINRQPEIALLVGYGLLLVENLMGGLPGFRRQAAA